MTTETKVEAVAEVRVCAGGGMDGRLYALILNHSSVQQGDKLYPASAITALEGEVERLRASVSILEAFVGNVRAECFDYFNEGIRPWPHHMQTLAWRADEAIKSSQTLTKESP